MSEACRHCHQILPATYSGLADGLNTCVRCAAKLDFSNLEQPAELQAVSPSSADIPHLSVVPDSCSPVSSQPLPLADIEEIDMSREQPAGVNYDVKQTLRLLLAERKLLKRKVVRLTDDNEALEAELTRVQHGAVKLERELMQSRELAARLRAKRAKAGLLESPEGHVSQKVKDTTLAPESNHADRARSVLERKSANTSTVGGCLPYAANLVQKNGHAGQQNGLSAAAESGNRARFSERESQLGQGAQQADLNSRSRAFINGGRG